MKTFFDVTNIFTPDILINYERLVPLEASQQIIFYKKSNIGAIFLSDGNLYFEEGIHSVKSVLLTTSFKRHKPDFNYALNMAHSFKNIRSKYNIEILNAVIGFFIEYDKEEIFFDTEKSLYEENYDCDLIRYQKLEKNICFKKMNQVLSLIYSFRIARKYIYRFIDTPINVKHMSNHEKIYFLNSYIKYKNQNRLG